MKLMEWVDEKGKMRRALVRDWDTVDDAIRGKGISQDPPDIEQLDWDGIKRELHNELVKRGLFSYDDVQRQQNGIQAAIIRVLKRRVLVLYK